MAGGNVEIESKFWVSDIPAIQAKLKDLGAELAEVRALEQNIRFDSPLSHFKHQHKVIRLRKYHDFRLTYKGPGEEVEGAMKRVEIETIVMDYENTRLILEAMGFVESITYEKYRTMFKLSGNLVTLDELPYGNFVEIEGESPAMISKIARSLGFRTDCAIATSYLGMFEELRNRFGLQARNLSFEELRGVDVDLAQLGYQLADQPR